MSDPDRTAIEKYGCLKEDGKGVERTVYAIGPDGSIVFAERGQASYEDVMTAIREAG